MTKTRLRRIARDFRDGILSGRSSSFMCFAICAPLQAWLSMCGYETTVVEADFGDVNHVWLALPGGDILDPTADQFGLEPVYLGPLPELYQNFIQQAADRGDGPTP